MTRRDFLAFGAVLPFATGCAGQGGGAAKKPAPKKPIAAAAPFVRLDEKWSADDLFEFLRALPPEERLMLKQTVGLLPNDARLDALKGGSQDARDVQKQLLWISSNILAYPFRDETKLNYHDLVTEVAVATGMSPAEKAGLTSFQGERRVIGSLFQELWDKLSADQRVDLMRRVDPHGATKDAGAIAAMTGAAALAVFSTTVNLMGFPFYVAMSVCIHAVATAAGIMTLPPIIYWGASALVGTLAGPVGWAVVGAGVMSGLALAGRANAKKTAAAVCQIHALKVEALAAAGVDERDIFRV